MKLKGINTFEHHVEKIVVGAVGLGVLGVVGWQLLSQSTINVGKAGDVPLSNAYKPVETEAARLQQQAENASPTLPSGIDISPLSSYATNLSKPLTTSNPLPTMASALVLGPSGGVVAGQAVFAGLVAPAPTDLVAAQFRGTIQPAEKVANPGLVPFLPKEQPYDKAAVSIQARFDGKALRAALEADPDGAGPKSALPMDWWMSKTEILAFEVERQEETAPGVWSDPVTLPALPGRLDFLKQWNEQVKEGADVDRVLPEAAKDAEDIQRPKYYAMMFGEWVEPSVLIARTAANFDPIRYKQLCDEYGKEQSNLASKQDERKAIPPDEPKNQQPQGPSGPSGRGPAPRKGGGNVNQDPNSKDETNAQKRGRLDGQIRKIESHLKEIAKQIAEMGGTLPGQEKTDPAQPAPVVDSGVRKPLLDDAEIKLFAHDITAEPGKSYRYRARVVLNNPMFGRDIVLKKDDPAQLELAKSSMADTAWTDWSGPVEVDRDAYWFITGTSTDQLRQNIPTARAEMFQFYYGFYRRAEVALEPGDPVMGRAELPKLWIYDEKKLNAMVPGVPNPEGNPRDPGGGKGRRANMPGPNGGAAPPPPPPQKGMPPLEGATPAKTELRFTDTSSVVLLDVRNVAGSEERSVAVLRNQEGQVVSKSPDKDRKSDVYKRVASSADAGVQASKAPEPEKPKAVKPEEQPRERPQGKPGPGGGGGGGGG